MALTGTGLARLRVCHQCLNWYARSGNVEKWPHCDAVDPPVELSRETMEGPDTNCPRGKWAGLDPVDLEAEADARKADKINRQTEAWERIVDDVLPGETSTQTRRRLDKLVARGLILTETAQNVEAYVADRNAAEL